MTRSSFADIRVGEPVTEVQKKVGDPYSITKNSDGSEEYEYIERILMGSEVIEENHYFLNVTNSRVVSKSFKQNTPPAYDTINDDDPNDTDLQ